MDDPDPRDPDVLRPFAEQLLLQVQITIEARRLGLLPEPSESGRANEIRYVWAETGIDRHGEGKWLPYSVITEKALLEHAERDAEKGIVGKIEKR